MEDKIIMSTKELDRIEYINLAINKKSNNKIRINHLSQAKGDWLSWIASRIGSFPLFG